VGKEKMTASGSVRLRSMVTALTAAAQVLNADENTPGGAQPTSTTRVWQHAVLAYADSIPELGASSMYVGNCLSRIKLKGALRNPDGTVSETFEGGDDDSDEVKAKLDPQIAEWVAEILAELRCEIGGQSEFLRRYGEQMFLTGELYVVPEQTLAGMTYDVLSVLELVKEGRKGWMQVMGDGAPNEPLEGGTEPIRVWRRDRRFSRLASSSCKSCLTILDELDVLTRLVKASAVCRLALAGILCLPEELDYPIDETAPDGTELNTSLLIDIINAACKAIDDPSAASAFVPYILQGPADILDHVKHIAFQSTDELQTTMRSEAQMRLSQGLDLPCEVITGHGDTTFANAAVITDSTFNLHIEPTIQMLVDALTIAILWPALALKMGLSDAQIKAGGYPDTITSVGIHYDASNLISHPNLSQDIIDAFKADVSQCAISIKELRMALKLDPDGGPDDEEKAMRIDAIRLTKIREQIIAPAGDAAVPLEDAAAKAVVPGQSAGSKLIGTQATAAENAPAGETAGEAQATAPPVVAVIASASLPLWAYSVVGAADMTIERCAERVGGRVRAKLAIGSSERDAIEGVAEGNVAGVLGPDAVARILGKEDIVFREVASFSRFVAKQAKAAGHPHPGVVAEGVGKLVAAGARDRLYGSDSSLTVELLAPLLIGV
jgi:hypothetical protein